MKPTKEITQIGDKTGKFPNTHTHTHTHRHTHTHTRNVDTCNKYLVLIRNGVTVYSKERTVALSKLYR